MKAIIKNIFTAVLVCLAISFAGCSKSSDAITTDEAAKFEGYWTGLSCGSATRFTLTKVNNVTLTSTSIIGSGACNKSIVFTLTALGNTLTVPTQTFQDNCGNTYTIAGAGTIYGNTLTLTQNITGTANTSCTFVGTNK